MPKKHKAAGTDQIVAEFLKKLMRNLMEKNPPPCETDLNTTRNTWRLVYRNYTPYT